MAKAKPIIAISAPVSITAGEGEGDKKGPAQFTSTFYTGVAMNIEGWDLPVVIDLAGLKPSNVLVANLDHKTNQRVGNFAVANNGQTLIANGTATAKTAARDEVIDSALGGYQWQASLEVNPQQVETIKAGKKVEVNGQTFEGPIYLTRKGTLKGFAFVSHGADDNTSALIAAEDAASKKEIRMKSEIKAWAEKMGIDTANLDEDQQAAIEANYEGLNGKKPTPKTSDNPFERRKIEAERRKEIYEIADRHCEQYERAGRADQIEEVRKLADHAIEASMSVQAFRLELLESGIPLGRTVPASRDRGIDNKVLEAAVCQAGRLSDIEKHFTDQQLQIARDKFKDGIGLNQLFMIAAEANGYRGSFSGRVNIEAHNAAFGMVNGPRQYAGAGFSMIDIANVVAATANKFLHEGWMTVDTTALRIAKITPVRNFQQITTISLTGDLTFDKIGADGEIKHGVLDDMTYTNQADTYARMLAITRRDLINDDLGALTSVPRRLGRGGALKLNDLFWTEFLGLVGSGFFASGNNNINTGVADMTIGGLGATETIFMNQTDPDGKPVGFEPRIILVPPALKATATALMDPQGVLITGASGTISSANVFKGRFRVESSPYISNSTFTGNTSTAWWMLADPQVAAVIEIVALNGRVEPIVETADANFNVLGTQMRGYSDIGVNEQEKRAGVHADGGAS